MLYVCHATFESTRNLDVDHGVGRSVLGHILYRNKTEHNRLRLTSNIASNSIQESVFGLNLVRYNGYCTRSYALTLVILVVRSDSSKFLLHSLPHFFMSSPVHVSTCLSPSRPPLLTSLSPLSPVSFHGHSGCSRETEREEARAAREKEKEREVLREHYLGKKKVKKKIVKPSEKFSKIFQFDWDASEDTSRDANPLYNQRAQVRLSGGGFQQGWGVSIGVGGFNRGEYRFCLLFYLSSSDANATLNSILCYDAYLAGEIGPGCVFHVWC